MRNTLTVLAVALCATFLEPVAAVVTKCYLCIPQSPFDDETCNGSIEQMFTMECEPPGNYACAILVRKNLNWRSCAGESECQNENKTRCCFDDLCNGKLSADTTTSSVVAKMTETLTLASPSSPSAPLAVKESEKPTTNNSSSNLMLILVLSGALAFTSFVALVALLVVVKVKRWWCFKVTQRPSFVPDRGDLPNSPSGIPLLSNPPKGRHRDDSV